MINIYYKQQIGRNGEDIVADYLCKKGYTILDRNFNSGWGEIDIIALDKNEVVFVEVKTRSNKKYGNAAEAVDFNKKKHLFKTIEYYLYCKKLHNIFIRIDVVEVYFSNGKVKINHIKKAIE